MDKLSASELKRLRESEFYKFENVSDFKTIRQCKSVAKELYECLKFFDSRCTRFAPLFTSYNSKVYNNKRARVHPSDYFSLKFLTVDITLFKKGDVFFVGTQGFKPWSFPCLYNSDSFYKYAETKNFVEAKDNFSKICCEFFDRYFNGDHFGM